MASPRPKAQALEVAVLRCWWLGDQPHSLRERGGRSPLGGRSSPAWVELQDSPVTVGAGSTAGAFSDYHPRRLLLPETRGVPTENRVARASRERPGEAVG